MRIGLDFDNTLARYDHVFAAEAKLEKLVPTEWQGNKKQLRDSLLSLEDGERSWQRLCCNQRLRLPTGGIWGRRRFWRRFDRPGTVADDSGWYRH